MATTYDKASLVMIPSGYKDDKLYSIKPTDGSGDFTFSRDGAGASPATRVNASGLIEKGRTNIAIYSEDATNAVYAKTNISVTANNATSPIGTATADTLTATANGATLQGVVTAVSGRVYTMSVYIKRRTGTGQVALRGINNVTTNVTITNDWQRYEVFMVSDSTNGRYGVYLATSGDEVDVWGFQLEESLTATDYIATTTTAVSAGLLGDMPRLDYSGGASCPSLLLEPSRTNLFDHSEYITGFSTSNTGVSIEENATTSPEGVVNAAKIKEDGTNGAHAVRQLTGPTLTSGTNYTFSFFAKKGERSIVALSNTIGASNDANCFFDLENGQVLTNTFNSASIEDFGNGWYRCIATDTADANDDYDTRIYIATADNQFSHQGVSGNGLYIFGLQLEAGSYPTSYIPTYGTATGRAYDACANTSASSIIGQTEGTLYAEVDFDAISEESRFIQISDGTNNNRFYIGALSTNTINYTAINGGTTIVNISSGAQSSGVHKVAAAYANNDFVLYLDGTQIAVDTSGSVPAMDEVSIGYNNLANNRHTAYGTKQAVLFPTRLTNAELAALTA